MIVRHPSIPVPHRILITLQNLTMAKLPSCFYLDCSKYLIEDCDEEIMRGFLLSQHIEAKLDAN